MTLYEAIKSKIQNLEEIQGNENKNYLTLKQIRVEAIQAVNNILYSFKDKLENVEVE